MSRRYKRKHTKLLSKEKIHTKMSRDGLVERNAVTGEEMNRSTRQQDFKLNPKNVAEPFKNKKASTLNKKRKYRLQQKTGFRDEQKNKRDISTRQHAEDIQGKTSSGQQIVMPNQIFESNKELSQKVQQTNPFEKEMDRRPLKENILQSASRSDHSYGKLLEKQERLQFTDIDLKEPIQQRKKHPFVQREIQTIPETKGDTSTSKVADTKETYALPSEKINPKPIKQSEPTKSMTTSSSNKDILEFSMEEQSFDSLPKQKDGQDTKVKVDLLEEKISSKKRTHKVRFFDDDVGRRSRLHYKKENLSTSQSKSTKSESSGVVKGVIGIGKHQLHQKISEAEKENVALEALHKTEKATEAIYSHGRLAKQYAQDKPLQKIKRFENKRMRLHLQPNKQKSFAKKSKLESNLFSRAIQKRKIKQQYVQSSNKAKKALHNMKATGNIIGDTKKLLESIVRKNPTAIVMVVIIVLLGFVFTSLFSSIGSVASTGIPAIVASSYLAKDVDLNMADLKYSEWETNLLLEIGKTEQIHSGYDEYRYNIGDVSHNPYELVAFLTAKYQGFHYSEVESILHDIFAEQYHLIYKETLETRYSKDENIHYEWRVLTVTLTARSLTDILMARMNDEEKAIYTLLMQTKGNRQYVDSPFDFNWLPSVTSYFGYRVHPISGEKDDHKGIDIAVPIGTEIHAGYDGKVTFAGYNGGYGYVVVMENDKGLVTKYAHCNSVLVSVGQEIKRGDVIALSGNTGNSTGPHLHFEVMKEDTYLNPLYFSVTKDIGFQSPIYGNPGSPMGDGSYRALIQEAEKYLNFPYVWGGSSPSTSFDCSGFVCYVLNQSGVASVGRTTATGLYNLSTPISQEEAQPGDLIFFHSTYSTTSPVTHVGIYVGNGMMIHCGDPIQYTSINSSYWRSHFFGYGRIH